MAIKPTDIAQFFSELDAGTFELKLGNHLSTVAGAVLDLTDRGFSGRGEIVITLKIAPQPGNKQAVIVNHKLTVEKPTLRGSTKETDAERTLMYVGEQCNLTLFPEKQGDMFHQS